MSNSVSVKPKTRRNGKAAFLAALSAIKAEMADGHTLAAIYTNRASSLGISYSHFTRYVNRYISSETKNSNESDMTTTVSPRVVHRQPVRAPDTAPARRHGGPIVTPATTSKKFVFDPTAAHTRKDELF
ncbi:MAG: TraK family protein [Alphaproteobacteria bacterium]